MKPIRRAGLIIQEVEGEYLVFDDKSNVAAALNLPATRVFQVCDGTRDVDQIIDQLSTGDMPLSEDAVRLALAELAGNGLIDDAPTEAGTSRRKLLMALGAAAALAVPAVELIKAPAAAAVASGPTPTPEPTTALPTTYEPTTALPTTALPTPEPTNRPTTPEPSNNPV
jgi:hypothetical protein